MLSSSGFWGMPPRAALASALVVALAGLGGACSRRQPLPQPGLDANVTPTWPDSGPPDAFVEPVDAATFDAAIDANQTCAAETVSADVVRLPVDIIWVVDNSASMAPSIAQVQSGMNAFAAQLARSDLDYRIILLALRGVGETTVGSSRRYQVCMPPPVGGPNCADNPPSFYQVEVDVRSTQPLEQILGTLGQVAGYREGDALGSRSWLELLRPEATKSFVVVTDDNARLCGVPLGCSAGGSRQSCNSGAVPFDEPSDFESYPGGQSPFSPARDLGPGILTSRYDAPDSGLIFADYVFNAIYGWGSESDDWAACGPCGTGVTDPVASPGTTYTALVRRTGGVRARICDGAAAWTSFFAAVASSVEDHSRIDCEVTIPEPPEGQFFIPDLVNVEIRGEDSSVRVGRVEGLSACNTTTGGWYYDDNAHPTKILLCPASCDLAREEITTPTTGVDVSFGCDSLPG